MDKRPPFYQSYQRVSFLLSPLCSFPTRTLFHSAKKDLLRVSFKFFLFSFFFATLFSLCNYWYTRYTSQNNFSFLFQSNKKILILQSNVKLKFEL